MLHPVYDAGGFQIYNAHVLDGLRALPAQSVQVITTSPPYWGLRAYGTEGQIWQGEKSLCAVGAHAWQSYRHEQTDAAVRQGPNSKIKQTHTEPMVVAYDTCLVCGAWRGELGGEPTPEMFVLHMVQIFREARRVLRDDGLLWLNLGSSYWAGKGQSAQKGSAHQEKRHVRGESINRGYQTVGGGKGITRPADGKHLIFKPKDLVMIPHMVALAMQADGWVLRNEVPWYKKNCMPQSMADRLTVSHEAVFLFSKSKSYFYDVDAVRVAQALATEKKYAQGFGAPDKKKALVTAGAYHTGANGRDNLSGAMEFNPAGRQLRTKDLFDAALDELIDEQRVWLAHLEGVRANGGVMLDANGEPLALLVTTSAYKGAHFAVFSEKLVTPMLQLSTSAFGCCAKCGTPYRRVVKKGLTAHDGATATKSDTTASNAGRLALLRQAARARGGEYVNARETVGWEASCACEDAAPNANGNGANTGANNKLPYKANNPHRMRLYKSKYDNGGQHGQAVNGFQRSHSSEAERGVSRARAALLYPGDERAQQDYINFIHDHGAVPARETIGWEKGCAHKHADVAPCVAMDIFHGAGTTMVAAWRLGLRYVGLELNADFINLSLQRLADEKAKAAKEKEKAARAQAQSPARGRRGPSAQQTPMQMAFSE